MPGGGTGRSPKRLHYHEVAGQSLDRLAALSDGIFGVAMTLLVLNLHVRASNSGKIVQLFSYYFCEQRGCVRAKLWKHLKQAGWLHYLILVVELLYHLLEIRGRHCPRHYVDIYILCRSIFDKAERLTHTISKAHIL